MTLSTEDALAIDQSWGWAGSVQDFLEIPEAPWLAALESHHSGLLMMRPSGSQVDAWSEEYQVMQRSLRDLCVADPEVQRWSIIFEFELPLEGGRRPDVVVLAGGSIVVLEFKQDHVAQLAALDQVEAYARDLSEYHQASHDIAVTPVLVLTRANGVGHHNTCDVTDPSGVAVALLRAAATGSQDLRRWLLAPYAPLPSLIAAARLIFQHEPLPAIRRALSSAVPEAVEVLGLIAEDSAKNGERALAFVAGVPGSGKTLVGLSLVYERTAKMSAATFLSGNGPLVEVLRDALQSKTFVRDLHAFIQTYGLSASKVPLEHVIVFDEAQRAWDAVHMEEKRGVLRSEPELLIEVAERLPGWATLVGLVGDGQEINAGEEGGIGQWRAAIETPHARLPWRVHCPPRLAGSFDVASTMTHEALDLTKSLRSRRAQELHDWVAALLSGALADAARFAATIQGETFPMYVTRDLQAAKAHVRTRYANEPAARYGLLASSKTQTFLPNHGVDSSWPATRRVKLASWYNRPADDPRSCCALAEVVTEFGCQGLELDTPIVCWGDDLVWSGTQWMIKPSRPKYAVADPQQLRKNAYRVLLTRGRDGLLIFVPSDGRLDATEHALLASGVRPLV